MSALHTSRNGMQFQSVNRSQFELQSEQERLLQQQGLLKSLNPVLQNGQNCPQLNADIQQTNSGMHPTLPTLEGYVALNGGHTNGQLLRQNNLSNSSPQLNNTGQTYTQVPVNGQSIIQHGRNNGTVHHMPQVIQNAYAPQTVTRFKNAYGPCRNRNNNSSMSTLPASSSSNGTLYQTNINGNTQLQNLQNHQGLGARAVRGLPLQNLGWKSSGGQHRIDHEREEIADLIGLKGLQGRVENNQISRNPAKNISTTATQQTAASVSDVGHYMGHFKLPNAKGKAGKTTPFAKKRMPQSSSKYDIPPSPSVVGISPDFWEYINSPAPAQQQEEEEDVPTSTGASSFWVCDPVTWQQEQEKQRRNSKPDHVASGSFLPVTSHPLAQTPIQVPSDGTVTFNPTYTTEHVTAHNGRHPTSQRMVYPTEDVTTVTTLCSGTKAAATCSSVLSGTQSGVNGGARQREYVSIADPSIQTVMDTDEDEEFAMPKIVSCYSLNPQTEDHATTHDAGVESRGPTIGGNPREKQGKGNLGCNKKTPLVKVIPVPTTKRGRRKSELNVQTVVSDDSLARTIAKTKVMLGWGESTIEPSTSDRPHSASPQATSPMMGDQPARSRHISTELCKTKKQKGKGTKRTKSPKLRNKLENVQSCPLANWISSTQTVEPTMNVLSSPTDQTAPSNTRDVTEKHHSVLTLHKTGGVWQATPGAASDSSTVSASNAPSYSRSSGSFSHATTTKVSKTSYRPVHTGETVASQRVRAASLDSPLLSASNSNSNFANIVKSSVSSQKVHTNLSTKPNYASDISPPSDQPLDFTKMKTRPNLTKVKPTFQDEVQDAPLNLKCPLPDAPLDYSMKTLRKKEEQNRKGVGEVKKHKEAEEITGALNLTAERTLHRAPLVTTSSLSSPAPSANSVATLSSDSEFPFLRRSELDSESSEECLSTEGLDTDTSQNDDVAMVKSLEKVITVSAEASPEKEHTEGTLGALGSLDTHAPTQEGMLGTLVSLNTSSAANHETLVTPGVGGTPGTQGSLDTQGSQVGDIPDTFNLQTLCCVALSRLSSYSTDGDAKSNESVLPTVPTPIQPEQGVSARGDSAQKTSQSETVPRESEGTSSLAGKTEKSSTCKLTGDPGLPSPTKAKLISTLSNLLSVKNKLPPGGTVNTTPGGTAVPQSTNPESSSTPKPKYPIPASLSEAYSDISDSDNEDRSKKAKPGQSKLVSAGPSTLDMTLVVPVNTAEADSTAGGTTDKRLISILFVQNAAKGPQGNKDGQDATDLQDEPLKEASDSQDAEKQSHHPDVPHPISRVGDSAIETSSSTTTQLNSKHSEAVGQQQVMVASSPTQATAGTSPNVSPSRRPKNVTLRIPMTPDRVKKIKEITNKTKQNEKSSSSTSSNNSQNQPAEKADGVCDLPVTTGNDRAETSIKKPDSGTKGVPNEAETTSLTESEIDVRPASVSEQKPDEDVVQNEAKDISTVSEQNLEKESRSCPAPTSESDNPLASDQNYDSDISECPLVIDEARTSSQSSSKRARKKRKAGVSNRETASSSVGTPEAEKESSDQSENTDRTQDSNLEELKNGANATEEQVDQVEGIPESDSAKETDQECLMAATNPPILPQDNIPTHTSPVLEATDKPGPEIKSLVSINTKDTGGHLPVQSTQVTPASRTVQEHNSTSSSMETTVPICRLDSTEMTDNFSIISNNTVINIRPESLDVVIEAKKKRKAKKARADNIFAAIGEPELLLDEEPLTLADASSSDDIAVSNNPALLQENGTAEAVDLPTTATEKEEEKATEKPSTPPPKANNIAVPTPVTRLGQENDSLEMQEECCNEYDNMYLNNSQTSSELHDGLEASTAEAGVPEPNPGSYGEGFEPPSAKISDDQDEDEASTVDQDKKKRSVNDTEQDTEIEAEESAKKDSDAEKASETSSPVTFAVKAELNDTKDDDEDLFAPFTAIKVKKERMSFDSDSTPFKRKTPRKHGYHVSDAHAHAHVETSGIRAKRRRLVKKIDDSAEKKQKSPKVSPKKAMSYILLSDSSESSDETEIIMSRPRGRVMPKKSAAKTTENDKEKSKTEDLLKRVKTEPNDQIAPFSSRASITTYTTPAMTLAENSETKDDEKATEEPTENPVATPRSNSYNSNNFRLHSDKEDPKASVEKAEIDENLAPLCALARMAAATSPAVPKSLANLSVDISQKSATEVIKVKPFSSDPYDFQEEKKEPVSIDISECVAKNKVSPRVIKLKSLSSTLSPEKYKSNGLKRKIKSPILLKKRRFASGSSKRLESYSERRNQKGVKKILIQSSIFGKKKTHWPFRKKAKGLAQVYSKKGWKKSGVEETKATLPDLKEERGKKRKLEETVKEQAESLEKVPKQEISPEQEKDSLKALVDEIIAACPFKTPRKSLLSTAPESSPEAQSDSTLSIEPASPPTPPREQRSPQPTEPIPQQAEKPVEAAQPRFALPLKPQPLSASYTRTARMGHWGKRKIPPVPKHPAPLMPHVKPEKISKAAMEESIYLTMQKLLNGALILDQRPNRGRFPQPSWNTCFDSLKTVAKPDPVAPRQTQTNPSLPPRPPPPSPPRPVRHFESTGIVATRRGYIRWVCEENVRLKPCFVKMVQLRIKSKTVKIHRCR